VDGRGDDQQALFAAPRLISGRGASAPTPGRRRLVVTSASGSHNSWWRGRTHRAWPWVETLAARVWSARTLRSSPTRRARRAQRLRRATDGGFVEAAGMAGDRKVPGRAGVASTRSRWPPMRAACARNGEEAREWWQRRSHLLWRNRAEGCAAWGTIRATVCVRVALELSIRGGHFGDCRGVFWRTPEQEVCFEAARKRCVPRNGPPVGGGASASNERSLALVATPRRR
jgi:hypothetical protein